MKLVKLNDFEPELVVRYTVNDKILKHPKQEKPRITSSKDAHDYLKQIYNQFLGDDREMFFAIYLNRANKAICWYHVSTGGISSTVADPKIILRGALVSGASSLILSHIHPSGNIRPSESDMKMTRRIKKSCDTLGLELLDHIIVNETAESYYSFADEGIIND